MVIVPSPRVELKSISYPIQSSPGVTEGVDLDLNSTVCDPPSEGNSRLDVMSLRYLEVSAVCCVSSPLHAASRIRTVAKRIKLIFLAIVRVVDAVSDYFLSIIQKFALS